MAENLKTITDDNFEESTKNGVTLIDFYADWCAPCRRIAPIVEELAGDMKGKVSFGKIDVAVHQKTPAKFHVYHIPTLIVFKNGAEVLRIEGIKTKEMLTNLINSAL